MLTPLSTASFHSYRLAHQEFVSQNYFDTSYWELMSEDIHFKSLYNFTVLVGGRFGDNSAVFTIVADENIGKFNGPLTRCKWSHGPLTRYAKLRLVHAPGIPGTFSPPPRVINPDMHHGTCVPHVPLSMPGWLISGFL